jgi:glycosyltransferase involved in cell wall biosynthesis
VSRPAISVLVPTKNEEANLAACLASAAWADELVVVDSESTDRTREIAERAGARVLVRRFDDWSSQKNFALERLAHPWAFCLDADERVDAALAAAIAALPPEPPHEGYAVRRANHFLGAKVRHSGWGNDRVLRLFRRDRGRFTGAIHERVEGLASLGTLPGALVHHPYRTWADCETKLVRYARRNALEAYASGRRAGPLDLVFRPPARFLRMYLGQGGVLDGAAGVGVCGLSAVSVFMKYAWLWDATRRGRGALDEPAAAGLAPGETASPDPGDEVL